MFQCSSARREISSNHFLYDVITTTKTITQQQIQVTRQELEEAEKMQLSYIEDSRYTSTHSTKDRKDGKMVQDDVRIQFTEHIRVSLVTAAFMLMQHAWYIQRISAQDKRILSYGTLEQEHKDLPRLEHSRRARKIGQNLRYSHDSVLLWTLSCISSFSSRNISVFNDACPIHVYPSLLRSVEFALSGEGIDLGKMKGAAQHPKWELGSVCSGIFQLVIRAN